MERHMRSSRLVASAALAVMLLAGCDRPAAVSAGRGAPDPPRPPTIVGSEGKGMWAGAGVPAGYPPIFAARDGAVPAGVQPLPKDIFSSRDFYQDRALWSD